MANMKSHGKNDSHKISDRVRLNPLFLISGDTFKSEEIDEQEQIKTLETGINMLRDELKKQNQIIAEILSSNIQKDERNNRESNVLPSFDENKGSNCNSKDSSSLKEQLAIIRKNYHDKYLFTKQNEVTDILQKLSEQKNENIVANTGDTALNMVKERRTSENVEIKQTDMNDGLKSACNEEDKYVILHSLTNSAYRYNDIFVAFET